MQQTLCELLEEDTKEIMLALVPNMRTLIEKYSNDHTINQLPDPSPKGGDNTPTKGFGLVHSNTVGNKMLGGDFTSMNNKYQIGQGRGFGGGFKKLPSMNLVMQTNEPADDNSVNDYAIAPEFKGEIIYQELMPKLLMFDQHIHE